MIITINVDDVHPEEGWGLEGDKAVEYLTELNKEFGCTLTGRVEIGRIKS